jgi:hypothetical protein
MTRATSKRIAKLFGELCALSGLQPVTLGDSLQREGEVAFACKGPRSNVHGLVQLPTTLRGNQAERAMQREFSEMLGKLREAVAA